MSMGEVIRGVMPFMATQFAVMFLLVFFPVARHGAGALARRLTRIRPRLLTRRCSLPFLPTRSKETIR